MKPHRYIQRLVWGVVILLVLIGVAIVVRRAAQLVPGDRVEVLLAEGSLDARVERVRPPGDGRSGAGAGAGAEVGAGDGAAKVGT